MRTALRRPFGTSVLAFVAVTTWLTMTPACVEEAGRDASFATGESCMLCHNG